MTAPTEYRRLITVIGNVPRRDNRPSIDLTDKRLDVLISALEIADSGIVASFRELLDYMGGSDVKGDHPLARAHAVRDTLDKIELLTEHPPCQAMAPVETFDMNELTVTECFLMGRLRQGPVERFNVTAAARALEGFGLATIEKTGEGGRYRFTLTAKGKAAAR